jgi:hypothetical protein
MALVFGLTATIIALSGMSVIKTDDCAGNDGKARLSFIKFGNARLD